MRLSKWQVVALFMDRKDLAVCVDFFQGIIKILVLYICFLGYGLVLWVLV